jgi:hypothetical protein
MSPKRGALLDRQKVESILCRRFSGAPPEEIAAAANAIMGLDDEWEELSDREGEIEQHLNALYAGVCSLKQQLEQADGFRVLRRRDAH